MKWILTLALIASPFTLFAQETKQKEHAEAESASRRLLQKKRYQMPQVPAAEPVKQERQEPKPNDDFDPELDAIDDDYTKDEGINDE